MTTRYPNSLPTVFIVQDDKKDNSKMSDQPTQNGTGTPPQQPQQININTAPGPRDFPEMPYSWNVRVTGPEGFDEQFTVRAVNEKPFMDRVAQLKRDLTERGYKATATRAPQAGNAAPAPAEETAPLCAIHNVPMKKRTGRNGQAFWSCAEKLSDGQWCQYRPKQ